MTKHNDERKRIVDRVIKKLENPLFKKKVEDSISTIEKMFGTEIDITLVFNKDIEIYKDIFKEYIGKDELKSGLSEAMTLGELKNVLKNETDDNLKVTFDPLYLKKGINIITDVISTVVNDYIILIPKNKKNE